jgi:DNA invertase Pin-like site-specific DNA recombinase
MESAKPLLRRCAVYTRKSSEEGLEQNFNSLHAQREACEAFIKSQASEGWRLVKTHYDDGGLSGASMERPALQHLLGDIRQRMMEVVVVYKVDRLTRSLSDFAKIIEVFDSHQISFVAVTQQFNTTTSMGRLTLNVLLSFAQFEREVTGERIRDKIAASKRKGLWMGGVVPLGYDLHIRRLVINQAEAELARQIFRRYHPQRALHAALAMQQAISEQASRLRAQGRSSIEARVGLSTGEVVVRTIETGGHTEYTPIGPTANLAARLQTVAPPGSIAVSENLRRLCEGYFTFRELGQSEVKGISESLTVYQVTGVGALRTHFQLAARRGLAKFEGGICSGCPGRECLRIWILRVVSAQ